MSFKNAKSVFSAPAPAAYCTNGLCPSDDPIRRYNGSAAGQGRVNCIDRIQDIFQISVKVVRTVNVQPAPTGTLYDVLDYDPNPTAPWQQRGTKYVLLFPGSDRVEQEYSAFEETVLDQCGDPIGSRYNILQTTFAFDDTTCDYAAVLASSASVFIADVLAYADAASGISSIATLTTVNDQINAFFGNSDCATIQSEVAGPWNALAGSTITLGV